MKRLIVYQIDSFTKDKFKGNPAGVVVNADGLSDFQMQLIARELNNSETAFLISSNNEECDVAIRYFTPKTEVPTCGHATIAAMCAKAIEEGLDSCVLRLKTKIGVLPIEIIKAQTEYQIIMTQGQYSQSQTFEDSVSQKIICSLGLSTIDLDERCPIQIASTGHSKVMIGIKNRNKLNSLCPDYKTLVDISKEINCNGYFVFTFDSDDKSILTYGRMFAPAIGINEDPVTGNAYGPLGGYLIQNKIVTPKTDFFEFSGRQGEIINRLGDVHVKVKLVNGLPSIIQIKGDSVVIFKTEIETS